MSDQFSGCAAGECVWFGVSRSMSHDGLISFYNSRGFTGLLFQQHTPSPKDCPGRLLKCSVPAARLRLLSSKLARPPRDCQTFGICEVEILRLRNKIVWFLFYSNGNQIKDTEVIALFKSDFQYFLLLTMNAKKHKGERKLQIWKRELGFQTQTKVRECLNLSVILDQPTTEL
ncbi:hypothetical protein WISP_72345 [Willisornis vidua]|uniref:Uncharacterized protein n=1 Tax=Willisornis vidua TaxID=1566151 RepID=A0ABQ9D7J3_9PASS|nr:hypothetical protein WISP_72345 [Willisornis vidua]